MVQAVEEKHDVKVQRIVSSTLFQIDVDNKSFKNIKISTDNTDLEGYLSDLLLEINDKPQKRAYDFHRETTEFYTSLNSFFIEQDLTINPSAENLSSRLLDKEVDTDDRYGHLGASSYCQIWCSGPLTQAAIRLSEITSIPSLNFTPSITLAR